MSQKSLGQIAYDVLVSPNCSWWEGESDAYRLRMEGVAQAVRAAVLEQCIDAILAEKVDAEETQSDQDEAYNTGLVHATEAIRKLK